MIEMTCLALDVSNHRLTPGLIGASQQEWAEDTFQPIHSLAFLGWVQRWRMGREQTSLSPLCPLCPLCLVPYKMFTQNHHIFFA